MVLGYKIASRREFQPSATGNIEELAEKFKLPVEALRKIFHTSREIESKIPKSSHESEIRELKNKIEELERIAGSSGAFILPQVKNLINQTKGKVHNLELASSQEIDPVSETKNQIEDLEKEKRILEQAKAKVMEKYYNREIDDTSIKNIMDNYEQRLVESDVKIKSLQDELKNLQTNPSYYNQRKKDISTAVSLGQVSVSPQIQVNIPPPQLEFKLSNLFRTQQLPTQVTSPQTTQPAISETKIVEGGKRVVQEGVEIPQLPKGRLKIESLKTEETPNVSLTYPLIPRSPAKNEPVYAYAKIYWDESSNKYVYTLVEPQMTEKLRDMYQKLKEMLEQRLDIDFSKLKKIEAKDFLETQLGDLLKFFNFVLTENEKKILKYYMSRDFTGLGAIEPLLQDPDIEDISCDGVDIPIFIFHRNPDIGSIATNISFKDAEQLDSFIIRLAQLCGKSISVSQPLLDGSLPGGSRIQATLGTDIARRGSNFTIRKFTEEPLTPVHLMKYGTVDANILAYLWFVVDYGRSILVSGGTASGKTSLLNVLSLFIRPDKKLVSIEDTAELRLPHPHWVPVVARTTIGVEGKGEVDMFELLRESLRQRPDYIIVGEVRGKEAYILFQQMATGHPSLATIHAENIERLVNRLITPPISLPAGLINSLDIVVFLARMRYKEKFVRKAVDIVEIADFDTAKNTPVINKIYKWNPRNDKFEITNKSVSLQKIADFTGLTDKEIKSEIQRRILILEWMKENNVLDYNDVHRIFSIYYTDPERLLSVIQGAG